jgi:3-phytase
LINSEGAAFAGASVRIAGSAARTTAATAPAAAAPLAQAAAPARAAVDFDVTAAVQTAPVAHSGDAADGPAIRVDPSDPAKSAVIGTDKKGALEVYDLAGTRPQRVSGDYGNTVGLRGTIVISADDQDGDGALHVHRIDAATRQLTHLADIPTEVTAHGVCMYQSPATGALHAYPNSASGRVEQWEIAVSGSTVTAPSVRLFDAGSAVEGCYADERTGKLYLGEEDVGVWAYGAEPTAGTTRTSLDSAGSGGHLTADAEGVTAAGDRLFVSSQGSDDYTAHGRSSGACLGRLAVVSGTAADDCEDTDGIDATASALGSAFPQGMFVCQDGSDSTPGSSGDQNLEFVPPQRITASL